MLKAKQQSLDKLPCFSQPNMWVFTVMNLLFDLGPLFIVSSIYLLY